MTTSGARKIEVENFTSPGRVTRVDAEKYEAMKAAYLKVVTDEGPALTPAEIRRQVEAHLPPALFPAGEKAGWWAKCVQLDLEAKGVIQRDPTGPVRLRRTPGR
jgi:hypothetical protein